MDAELRLRIISAVILGIVAISATVLGGKIFSALVMIAGFFIYYEWSSITRMSELQPASNFVGWVTLILTFGSLFFGQFQQAMLLLLVGLIACILLSHIKYKNIWPGGGVVYAALPVIALAELRGDSFFGLMSILYIFSIVWATDIFAFFFGRKIQGPKLAPTISPGKTWSGAIFGLLFGVVTGCIVVLAVKLNVGVWVFVTAALISIFGQIGDLFESGIKRRFNVKDSSNLIPGHGGFMDRLDGVIFASIIAFALALYSQYNAATNVESDLAVYLLGL